MDRLEAIHDSTFKLLKVIKAICEKHGITYFLDAGTLLGAVRHKDFIPWDDDADLAMRRADYEKFVSVAHELPEPYKLVFPNEYGGYFFDFVPRILDMSFPLREETEEDRAQNNYQNRLAVDIFILDELPASKSAADRFIFRHKMIYGYAMAHRCGKAKKKYTFSEKMKVAVLKTVGKTKKLDKIFKMQDKLSTKYRGCEGEYYYLSNALMTDIHRRLDRSAYEKVVMLPIRDELFSCPANWDLLLTKYYGDYMTPPKEEDRRPLHI
jgi:lipopolysaccharide cholinephosphotransferase